MQQPTPADRSTCALCRRRIAILQSIGPPRAALIEVGRAEDHMKRPIYGIIYLAFSEIKADPVYGNYDMNVAAVVARQGLWRVMAAEAAAVATTYVEYCKSYELSRLLRELASRLVLKISSIASCMGVLGRKQILCIHITHSFIYCCRFVPATFTGCGGKHFEVH